jgi:hypothetical protein
MSHVSFTILTSQYFLHFAHDVVLKVCDVGLILSCNDVPSTLSILWSRDYVFSILEVGWLSSDEKTKGVRKYMFKPIKLGRVMIVGLVLQTQLNGVLSSSMLFYVHRVRL